MRTGKTIEPRRKPLRGEARRRRDDQHTLIAARIEARNGIADLRESGLQTGIEQLALRGERNRAHAALEQLDAEHVFKPANLMAQCARRDVQFLRGLGEAQMACGHLEGAQGIERRHRLLHEIISIMD